MGTAYPELAAQQARLETALSDEERRFGETLEQGMRLFDEVAVQAKGEIAGEDAFRLYDTYGFPVDLTADMARERGLAVDLAGFEQAMEAQRERARAASRFEAKGQLPAELAGRLAPTVFVGYDSLQANESRVLAIVRDGMALESLAAGERAQLILDRTPFYAESGGQVGDSGELRRGHDYFAVNDVTKMSGSFFGHSGCWHGAQPLRVGEVLVAAVDIARRQAIAGNHSATHLLHAALREVLGAHVAQKGSLVAPERLRLDFSHSQPLSRQQLVQIEAWVNAAILRNSIAQTRLMNYDDAIAAGAIALFGEKYGDEVRVLSLGNASTELCGGTHVGRTCDIGLFKIVAESGAASGVRRIEARTGEGALALVAEREHYLDEFFRLLATHGEEAVNKLQQLFEKQKKLERELDTLRSQAAGAKALELLVQARPVADFQVLAARLEGTDAKALREGMDLLRQRLPDSVILLAGAMAGRAALVASVNGVARGRIKAGAVVAHLAAQLGGKGGGRDEMAQGGVADAPQLPALLQALPAWLAAQLR
ncbi:alanyl-trna synthetase [Lasius niger]|uniref:Alanine--tRNA ligase n=1 Tax=Lasius niger TaxID=67767 RepID=A0A0J7K447_LASNI|nr:alanyl-trna synthetase [Lasius niger]